MLTLSTSRTTRLFFAALSIAMVNVCSGTPASAAGNLSTIVSDVAQTNTRLTAKYGKLDGQYLNLQTAAAKVLSAAKTDAASKAGLTNAEFKTFSSQIAGIDAKISKYQGTPAPGTWMASHPTAAPLLNEAEKLNCELSSDYLNLGGNYSTLEILDNSTAVQVFDKASVRGTLTQAQINSFNTILNAIQSDINADI